MKVDRLPDSPETEGPLKSEFVRKLEGRWSKGNFVCVGLDSDLSKIPESITKHVTSVEEALFTFNRGIIDATADIVCAYKANIAFYERHGRNGLSALERTARHLISEYPEVPFILDAKRGDIDNTNLGYVESAFFIYGADAATVHPYLGWEAMKPFLDQKDKGIIVLARTSNKGAGEFQDLLVGEAQEPLYKVVARNVATKWNMNGNCAIVAGATYPDQLAEIRQVVGDMPILIPGIGAQGGEVEATVNAGKDSRKWGMIINSSRGIIFASKGEDFASAARSETVKLSQEINKYR